jgi:hypothetical protein
MVWNYCLTILLKEMVVGGFKTYMDLVYFYFRDYVYIGTRLTSQATYKCHLWLPAACH